LLATLDPDVELRADAAAVQASLARQGAPQLAAQARGVDAVARVFKGRAQAAQLALIDGAPGLVFAPGGQPRAVIEFVIEEGRIVEIALIGDPDNLKTLELAVET
jgi:RNA polymerase sigma-70 factor (ECF subfamily)